MAIFVLVHGGYHGAWCYSRVAARLRAQHHDVFIPTLSGVGERAHLAGLTINLSTHIQDIVAVIQSHDLDDLILCGHSYGGMVITGVAGQVAERIRTLVYLDAVVPENGQSAFDVLGPERALLMLQAAGDTGTMTVAPGAEFYQVNSADLNMVNKKCTSHPIGCFIQKLHYTGKEVMVPRRIYVLAERYQSVYQTTYARVKGLPGWEVASLDCGHDVMIDEPDMLAAVLLKDVDY